MSTVQLPVAKGYDTQMLMHTGTRTSDVSLARELKKTPVACGTRNWSDLLRQIQKRSSKRKCKEREYHVQEDADVSHKNVKIFCNTNQF